MLYSNDRSDRSSSGLSPAESFRVQSCLIFRPLARVGAQSLMDDLAVVVFVLWLCLLITIFGDLSDVRTFRVG